MPPLRSITYGCHQGITWKPCMAIALDSTAFESTINIVCVSFGGIATLWMWRSWITTRKRGNV